MMVILKFKHLFETDISTDFENPILMIIIWFHEISFPVIE